MKEKCWILFFYLFISLGALGQASDSNQKTRIEYLYEHSRGLLASDVDSALFLAEELYQTAERSRDTSRMSDALNIQGIAYYNKSESNRAIELYEQSFQLKTRLGDAVGLSKLHNNMGIIYSDHGDYENAMFHFMSSMRIKEQMGDEAGLSNPLNNIGLIYYEQNDLEKALEYFQRGLDINIKLKDQNRAAGTFNNLGMVYADMGEFEKALSLYRKSYALKEELGDKMGMANALNNMGTLQLDAGQADSALQLYKQSLDIANEIGNIEHQALHLNNLARVYMKKGDLQKASSTAIESLQKSKQIDNAVGLKNASFSLYQIQQALGNHAEALRYYESFIEARDLILGEENQRRMLRQEFKYQYEKQKALDDAENEKLLIIEQQEKRKQEIITYASLGGLMLVAFFAFLIFNRLQLTKKQKQVIEKQKVLVETQHADIQASINYARRIQEAILPPTKLVSKVLDQSFIYYKPKDIVAGDFYWFEYKNEDVYLAAADCTGHGVPGAMVSVVCANALNRAVNEMNITEPGLILDMVRKLVVETFEKSEEEVKDGMDISFCKINMKTKKLSYAGAHNPLYRITPQSAEANQKTLMNQTHMLLEYKGDKQPIGKFAQERPFNQQDIQLLAGDAVYLSSDGFPDQFGGPKGRKYMYKRFKEFLLSIQSQDPTQQKSMLDQEFEQWRGEQEQIDDVCVIGFRI